MRVLSCSVMSDSWDPMDCSPPRSSVPGTGLSRKEYWSGLPFPPPRDLPHPRIKPTPLASPMLVADSLPLSHLGSHISYTGHSKGMVKVPFPSKGNTKILNTYIHHGFHWRSVFRVNRCFYLCRMSLKGNTQENCGVDLEAREIKHSFYNISLDYI